MTESWYKEICPNCKTINWVCNGDETDITAIDIDGFKCRECGIIKYFGDFEEDADIFGFKSLEDTNWELGLENPN